MDISEKVIFLLRFSCVRIRRVCVGNQKTLILQIIHNNLENCTQIQEYQKSNS